MSDRELLRWQQSSLHESDPISFFALPAGGRRAFNITTGIVNIGSGSAQQDVAALVNPADSGADIYLDLGEFGSSANSTFQRLRGATITPTGTPNNALNMTGGSLVSVGLMYPFGTYTRTGGAVTKTAHIAAYHQYVTNLKGRVILRPGQSAAWTIQQSAAQTHTASIYFEYWELPAS